MDDEQTQPTPDADKPAELDQWLGATAKNAQLNYGLMLSAIVFGVTSIIAVIFAYVNRAEASPLVASHYRYIIRTFWIGLLYTFISVMLMLAFIGIFFFFATVIWFLVRNIKGLLTISKGKPMDNPATWWV